MFAFLFDLGYEFVRIRPLQEEERRARFWEIIARPSPGNSGKTQALEYLNNQGVPLHGINLSCERHAGEWKAKKADFHPFDVQECIGGVYLQYANLPGANLSTANLRGARLDHANLKGAKLSGANLRGAHLVSANLAGAVLVQATANAADFSFVNLEGANLERADLFGTTLIGANLSSAGLQNINLGNASLTGADLVHADLSGARLGFANLQAANLSHANLTEADLKSTNLAWSDLSAANFSDAKNLTQEQLQGAWTWKDTPPSALSGDLSVTRTCDPGNNGERRKAYEQALLAGETTFANQQHCGPGGDLGTVELPDELRRFHSAAKSSAKPANEKEQP